MMFRHHPDGWIYLGELQLTLAQFLAVEPDYSLPEGAIGREYVPEERHTVFSSDGLLPEFCVLPWPEGDLYLSQTEQYQATLFPPVTLTLEQIKQARISELSQACEAEILAGFDSSVLGVPHRYGSDRDDQINLTGVAMAGIDLPYVCTDADGVKAARLHTAQQLQQLFSEGLQAKAARLFKFHGLRAQVEAATDAAAVEAIVW